MFKKLVITGLTAVLLTGCTANTSGDIAACREAIKVGEQIIDKHTEVVVLFGETMRFTATAFEAAHNRDVAGMNRSAEQFDQVSVDLTDIGNDVEKLTPRYQELVEQCG